MAEEVLKLLHPANDPGPSHVNRLENGYHTILISWRISIKGALRLP